MSDRDQTLFKKMVFKKLKPKFISIFLIMTFPMIVQSQNLGKYTNSSSFNHADNNDVIELLLIKDKNSEENSSDNTDPNLNKASSEQNDKISIKIDADDLNSSIKAKVEDSEQKKKRIVDDLVNETIENQKNSNTQVLKRIPDAPSDIELLSNLNDFTASEILTFLERKKHYLSKLSNGLLKIHLNPKKINGLISFVNDELYKSAEAFTKINKLGVNVSISTGLGLGLSEKLIEKFNRPEITKFIPKSGGFYYFLSLGLAIYRENVNGNKQWVLELFSDVEKLKSIKTWMLDANIGFSAGFSGEYSTADERTKKFEAIYGAPTGIIRRGNDMIYGGAGMNLSIAPLFNMTYVYIDHGVRFKILRVNLSKLNPLSQYGYIQIFINWLSEMIRPQNACDKIFN